MPVSAQRYDEIREMVRKQIIEAIKNDLPEFGGGESLMKEVWENLDGKAEFGIAEDEMRTIITKIEGS